MANPIEIHVTYRNDDYVKELERQLAETREQLNRAEYRYRCESVINMQLQDLCHEHGIKYREALKERPWEGEPAPR